MHNIYAYTKNTHPYPEFMSLNQQDDGRITLTVREPAKPGPYSDKDCGRDVTMELPFEALAAMADALRIFKLYTPDPAPHVIVNGVKFEWCTPAMTYDQLLDLASMSGTPAAMYEGRRKGDSQRSGIVHPGKTVEIEDGMVFTVVHTNNA